MEELKLSIEKLINESPVDEVTRHHNKSHISELAAEEIKEVSDTGILHTDKNYRTYRIEEAAIGSIKDRLGRWATRRNDLVLKARGAIEKQSNSELDAEKRKLTAKREELKSSARDTFMLNHNYADLKSNFESTKNRYETMRAELGGKPPVKSRLWLYAIAIMLVGFIEWFVNYSTFSTKYPAGIAFGATVLIALSIALASHFHGGLLKQRLALFSPSRKKEEKRQVILYQSFFSLLLVIALIIVTYNRYDILVENIVQTGGATLPGMDQEQESVVGVLAQFALLNVLVWIVGVAISYFIHDSRPDYQEAHKDYQDAKSKFIKVDKGLQEELERITHECDEEIQKLTNTLSSHQKEIIELQVSLDRLLAKESSIIKQAVTSINSMLEKHQSMLLTEFNAKRLKDIQIGPEALSVEQFKQRVVTVDSQFVRHALSLEAI